MPRLPFISVLIAAASLPCASARCAQAAETEDALIAVLKSDAPEKEKADACRKLARIGTAKAVPALVALLGQERLSHMARYALEPIPDPAVDVALRGALARLRGRALVGVIGSLGVRRDTAATGALAELLRADDAQVARAAARALGSFGTPAAADALLGALSRVPAGNRLAVAEGLLRSAESLAAGGKRADAIAIYDRLRALREAPHQVRTAALRGAVLARGDAGLPLLLEALRSRDPLLVRATARTSLEMPGAEVTKALAGALGELDEDGRILLAQALARRGDASAVPGLARLLNDPVEEVAEAARDALATLAGSEVDAAIAAMLKDGDPRARLAAIEVLGGMAGAEDFPALVELLVGARSSAERDALQKLLARLCIDNSRAVPGDVVIRKAVYGDLPDGRSADVTSKVAAMVKQGSLSIQASNANFGDTAPGIVKKLRVDYTVGGATRTDTVNENETLRIKGGKTPRAFLDALRSAAARAPAEAKEALNRVLRAAGGPSQ